MVERALTNVEPRSGLTISAQQPPCGARGSPTPLGYRRHPTPWRSSRPPRLGWRSARTAHSEPVGRPGSRRPNPSRVEGQPWRDGSLGTRLGPPRLRPPGAVRRCRAGAAKARSLGWVALAGWGFGGRRGAAAGRVAAGGLAGWRAGGAGAGRGRSRGRRRP